MAYALSSSVAWKEASTILAPCSVSKVSTCTAVPSVVSKSMDWLTGVAFSVCVLMSCWVFCSGCTQSL